MKFKNFLYPVILAPTYIQELNSIQDSETGKYNICVIAVITACMNCIKEYGFSHILLNLCKEIGLVGPYFFMIVAKTQK